MFNEICKREGVSYRRTYKIETDALRSIAKSIARTDYYEFSKELIAVDADKREAWLSNAVEQYKKRHKLKQLLKPVEVDSAMNVLFGG